MSSDKHQDQLGGLFLLIEVIEVVSNRLIRFLSLFIDFLDQFEFSSFSWAMFTPLPSVLS